MTDFWRASGYHLLRPAPGGRLGVTDEFLRAYIQRPELKPPEDAKADEKALHRSLLENPRRKVSEDEIAALDDADARDNYTLLLGFRDRLIAAGTIEDTYLGLFLKPAQSGKETPTPPMFIDQLVHVILRQALDGTNDPLRARAGEMLFRTQKVTIRDGAILAADAETVEMYAATGGMGDLGRLLVESQTPTRSVDLDVLNESNAAIYWGRDERHDTVLELTFGRPGLDAFARVLELWVRHFLDVKVAIQPVARISDERWVWHTGLDVEASTIMNDLYNGRDVDEERLKRILALFRLEFADPSVMRADLAGRPVYLGMAQDADGRLRLKPQNLLVNLPLASKA
jgi:hypothetical protein